jgi:hypothetical protein
LPSRDRFGDLTEVVQDHGVRRAVPLTFRDVIEELERFAEPPARFIQVTCEQQSRTDDPQAPRPIGYRPVLLGGVERIARVPVRDGEITEVQMYVGQADQAVEAPVHLARQDLFDRRGGGAKVPPNEMQVRPEEPNRPVVGQPRRISSASSQRPSMINARASGGPTVPTSQCGLACSYSMTADQYIPTCSASCAALRAVRAMSAVRPARLK